MPKIAIIVLHFGDKKHTKECIASLKNLNYGPKKIKLIIVDNDKKNLGYAGGMNKGIKIGLKDKSIKYFLLLNNDVVVDPNILIQFIEYSKGKNFGILGSVMTYFQEPDKIWFAGGKLNKIFIFTRHPYMNKTYRPDLTVASPDFITGAAMFVERTVFEKIGLFDEDYFLYWEDVDFCLRASNKGFQIFCINKPLVLHKISSSTGLQGSNTLSFTRAYYYARNSFLFIKKHHLSKFSGLIGQLFIRFPFYFFSLRTVAALKSYLRGLKDGLGLLYSS